VEGGIIMNDKLRKYLDGIFLPYDELKVISEIKEELYNDLKERVNDLKNEGYDDEAAYSIAVNSIGDVSEIVGSITAKTRELQQTVGMDFSKSILKNSDFIGVKVHDGKFNYSELKKSDFSNSDLSNSSFKCGNLENVKFDRANLSGTKIEKSNLKGASFSDSILDGTSFKYSDLAGISFDNQKLNSTIFDYSGLKGTSFRNTELRNVSFKTDVKKAIFDGTIMDKLTYAILKGFKANLDKVIVV
jgi:BTB/POZ domain-containing protein KCTD9